MIRKEGCLSVMKARVALVVAIVVGFVTIGLNIALVANKITRLQLTLRERSASQAKAETALTAANGNLERTKSALQQTTDVLATTERANQALVASVEEERARANKFSEKVALVQQELKDTKANLAAYESLMTLQQAVSASRQINGLQQELTSMKEQTNELTRIIRLQEAELDFKRGNIVFMPAALAGTVLTADPKWQFVVLDAGTDQGVVMHGELLVSRRGKLVGKVIVRRVDKNQSIANVISGWELTDILEGDEVIPAHPRS